MVKQHAHAMLANDRLGLLHCSGAFQSQRCTESTLSTSQSSAEVLWGHCLHTQECACVLTNTQMTPCNRESVCLHRFSWWVMDVDRKHTQSFRFLFTAFHLPAGPQRSFCYNSWELSMSRWASSYCIIFSHSCDFPFWEFKQIKSPKDIRYCTSWSSQ